MSGGFFGYDQYKMGYIAEAIEGIIIKNGNSKRKEDRYSWEEVGILYSNYSHKEIQKFQEAVLALRIAEVYANRVDYLVSEDDGENSFHQRLEDDLQEVKRKYTSEYFEKLVEMSLKDYYGE